MMSPVAAPRLRGGGLYFGFRPDGSRMPICLPFLEDRRQIRTACASQQRLDVCACDVNFSSHRCYEREQDIVRLRSTWSVSSSSANSSAARRLRGSPEVRGGTEQARGRPVGR